MNNNFTTHAKRILTLAGKIAEENRHSHIGTEHLTAAILKDGKSAASIVLSSFAVSYDQFMQLIDKYMTEGYTADTLQVPEFTPHAEKVLNDAVMHARALGVEKAGTEHILMAVLQQQNCVASRLLTTLNVNHQRLYRELLKTAGVGEAEQKQELDQLKPENRENGAAATPILNQYGRDLTDLAFQGKLDPVLGREREITRVIEILSRRKKNNPCLIGEPGVGKTAIVEGLAERIVSGNVPDNVKGKRVVVLDLSGMVAGTKYRGEFEERIKKMLEEIRSHTDIILFIDEIHTIIGAGGAEGALDASNILKPSLARGEIQLIGATTIDEFRKHIEKDAALERRFQQVTVEEPNEEETIEILNGLRPLYEQHHRVRITDEALKAAVKLSTRYLNDRYQPDKAIDLIDEAAASVQLHQKEKGSGRKNSGHRQEDLPGMIHLLKSEKEAAIIRGDFEAAGQILQKQKKLEKRLQRTERMTESGHRTVDAEDIATTLAAWTGIPVAKLNESESSRLAKLEDILHQRVIGQEEAVSAVAKAIRRGRVGLKNPQKPIGSFLFLGPTGVGKTELSKALAEAVFGSEDAIIRVDMSEYMEKASVSKLIGSPPGYVGYEEGGQLSEKVRRHPYSVILFDEIEKAHPDVFNILLQVLDDGRITDSQGRTVSFKECVIIMTSNAGANRIIQPKNMGFLTGHDEKQDYVRMKNQVMDEVRQMFRPEFLNRIDEIIVFRSLNDDDMQKIFDLLAADFIKRCVENTGIRVDISKEAKKYLLEKGVDQKYGARPIRRIIQTEIEDALAEKIITGEVRRMSSVTVHVKDKKLNFS